MLEIVPTAGALSAQPPLLHQLVESRLTLKHLLWPKLRLFPKRLASARGHTLDAQSEAASFRYAQTSLLPLFTKVPQKPLVLNLSSR
jgi:hypothetical protein